MEQHFRFCPQCGAKVKGTNEAFATPQTCPACKSAVLFWNVTKEPVGPFVEAEKIKPLLKRATVVGISIVAILYLLSILVLWLIGVVTLASVLLMVALIASGYAIAIFLGQQYKIGILSDAFKKSSQLITEARLQQIDVARKYYALQNNFQSIVDSETQELASKQMELASKSERLKAEFQERSEQLEAEFKEKTELALNDLRKREQELEIQFMDKTQLALNNAQLALQNADDTELRSSRAVKAMASKLLDESEKFLIAKLTTQNFSQSRDRFMKTVEFCEKVGYRVPNNDVQAFLHRLKLDFEDAVRKQLAKEEQARIKERLREELKVEQEFEREMKRAELERNLIERKLAEALAKAAGESSEVIEDLKRRLADAESKQRAISLAQQTKAGNVYVISNIGSFGESVFKIGMTRRLDPMDRIRELGDASVPFPFDVHMMIGCINAPTLENAIHRKFSKRRLNKVNFRKEFFHVTIEEIRKVVEEIHGTVDYVATPEALQYNESKTMTDEEFEFIEETVGKVAEDIDD